MEKVRPWCGQPSDRERLKNREQPIVQVMATRTCLNMERNGFQHCAGTDSPRAALIRRPSPVFTITL